MPFDVMPFVPRPCVAALGPLQNLGQRFAFAGFDNQTELVVKHGEVQKLKIELLLGFSQDFKKEFLEFLEFHRHLAAVHF
jgi:hypothetical protein